MRICHVKVGETACNRAMKKTGSYRHKLTTCKKTRFVVSKAWNWCLLSSNCHEIFKSSFFVIILTRSSIFLFQFANFFASISIQVSCFYLILFNFSKLGWNLIFFQKQPKNLPVLTKISEKKNETVKTVKIFHCKNETRKTVKKEWKSRYFSKSPSRMG